MVTISALSESQQRIQPASAGLSDINGMQGHLHTMERLALERPRQVRKPIVDEVELSDLNDSQQSSYYTYAATNMRNQLG